MRKFILGDCMDSETGLPSYPDKFFDLAIVDPPYGMGQGLLNFRFVKSDRLYENVRPELEYFEQLVRVSKNQIIWGGNYFADYLPISKCWISWFKNQPVSNFSDFELAWTSFNGVCKQANLDSYGFRHADKRLQGEATSHPSQKPVALYRWLLENYAKPGDLILDTHVGSASSLIACEQMGFNYVGYEIDPDYYRDAVNRMKKGIQTNLFAPGESKAERELIQTKLFEP